MFLAYCLPQSVVCFIAKTSTKKVQEFVVANMHLSICYNCYIKFKITIK